MDPWVVDRGTARLVGGPVGGTAPALGTKVGNALGMVLLGTPGTEGGLDPTSALGKGAPVEVGASGAGPPAKGAGAKAGAGAGVGMAVGAGAGTHP